MDDVGTHLGQLHQGLRAIGGRGDLETFVAQHRLDGIANGGVVIDDENGFLHALDSLYATGNSITKRAPWGSLSCTRR